MLVTSGVISARPVNDPLPFNGNCFSHFNFLIASLARNIGVLYGRYISFCWNRSKRSQEKGDLTGKSEGLRGFRTEMYK